MPRLAESHREQAAAQQRQAGNQDDKETSGNAINATHDGTSFRRGIMRTN
jgi:hypothetical protein